MGVDLAFVMAMPLEECDVAFTHLSEEHEKRERKRRNKPLVGNETDMFKSRETDRVTIVGKKRR